MAAIAHGHDHGHDPDSPLHHQFEDIEQQNESYIVGMWTFLVTEVMFFGALFLMYTLYRWTYQEDFWRCHNMLDVTKGGINTMVLLFSSFAVVMAVQGAQLKKKLQVLGWLAVTQACALTFLVIKYFEYTHKFHDRLYPGVNFTDNVANVGGANLNVSQLFFGLYFGMTGLHGVHVLIGMLIFSILMVMWAKGKKIVVNDFVPTEMVGLYWHFVDLVWIFLFPLFYLMPKPH